MPEPLWPKNIGQSCKDKLEGLRSKLDKTGAEALVVSMLDEVAWLFNLRGADIAYNPVSPLQTLEMRIEKPPVY